MQIKPETMIVTRGAQGIGAGVANAFSERGDSVVVKSPETAASTFAAADQRAVVRGDIGDPSTARDIVSTAIESYGSIDGFVNNAGIFVSKAFAEYTAQDFDKLFRTNLPGA
jgi:NAD(P)-dependent dehydrogenase (short-subunit alcohol dehydrogenase family)